MVYITGDMHGDPRDLIRFSEVHSLTPEDSIIILGDAGFNFYLHGRDQKAKKLASRIPATLLCIHGNREVRAVASRSLSRGKALRSSRHGGGCVPEYSFRRG